MCSSGGEWRLNVKVSFRQNLHKKMERNYLKFLTYLKLILMKTWDQISIQIVAGKYKRRLYMSDLICWSTGFNSLMSIPPTDPTLYRFYEILQVYGYPMKAVIHEKVRKKKDRQWSHSRIVCNLLFQFGDGIMSAIDYTCHIDKVRNKRYFQEQDSIV
jgi:hypothetical protein